MIDEINVLFTPLALRRGAGGEASNSLQSLFHAVIFGAERDADIAGTIAAKDKSGGDKHPCLVEHTLGELLSIPVTIGNLSPEEHTHLFRVISAPECLHDLLSHIAAVAVSVDIGLLMPLLAVVVSGGGSQLYASEGS